MGHKAPLEHVIDRAVRKLLLDLPSKAPDAQVIALNAGIDWLLAKREVAASEKAHCDRREPGKAGRAGSARSVALPKARASHTAVQAAK